MGGTSPSIRWIKSILIHLFIILRVVGGNLHNDLAISGQVERDGGCQFKETWFGSWFQSGMPALITINSTFMSVKGECAENDGDDKYLIYDRSEDCYRCMVIHAKHESVLQYKETFCSPRESLAALCDSISGDAPLYSMFRKYPQPAPQPCPFRPAPFSFTYSRGAGDCINPPSRAESCTDDSRLLLRYMACPDVPGTESNVEELVCLAAWKEGSTRYLIGQISQVQRRNTIASDEDTYRCFVYKGQHNDKSSTYYVAQSGDASCNGLSSPTDGSRTMRLASIDDEHHRCRFPAWIVDHHKWFTLDHTHQYHFTTKNATLKIMNEDGTEEEKRLVCHSILEQKENQQIKLVAHVTRGCQSGHTCLVFYRREGNVLELQQGAQLWDSAQDACIEPPTSHFTTLITTTLVPMRCPIFGRFSVIDSLADRRRRRQQLASGTTEVQDVKVECVNGDYDSLHIGCGTTQDSLEFKSACMSSVYTCYGNWRDGNYGYLIAAPVARASTHPKTFCFIYRYRTANATKTSSTKYLSISGVARTCDRAVVPGIGGDKAYNLTVNGTCDQNDMYSDAVAVFATPMLVFAIMAVLFI